MTEGAVRQRIGHYLVEAPLGRGAMGTVYLARDERIGRRVALKQLQIASAQFEDAQSAAEFYLRLQREAEVCGSLQHPNIVTLYDVGYERDRISYLALEYVAGETLLDLLKRHRPRPLPVETALRIAADILRGLAYAHAKGIVHRDIKPANILIGEDGVAKLADFGIARPQQSSLTVAGAMMGTPNYMPPEQVRGIPATPRSDLFSAGILLFEMVTGTKPFAASELAAILEKIVREPTPSAMALNPEVSPELEAVIQRLTAKAPEERFATATEALDAIERLRMSAPAAAPPAPPPTEVAAAVPSPVPEAPAAPRTSALRRPLPRRVFAAIALACAMAAAIPCLILWSRIDARPTAEISPAQLAEFAQKREALRVADELFRSARYEESLSAYETYLARYPHSAVAREGAERAAAALDDAQRKDGASRAGRSQKRSSPTLMQDIKRSVKRLFRNQ